MPQLVTLGSELIRINPSNFCGSLHGWWDPKGYIDKEGNHQQAELDIVALPLNG